MADTSRCTLCGQALGAFKYIPMKGWQIEGMLCGQCYDKKLMEHYIAPDRRGITKR